MLLYNVNWESGGIYGDEAMFLFSCIYVWAAFAGSGECSVSISKFSVIRIPTAIFISPLFSLCKGVEESVRHGKFWQVFKWIRTEIVAPL
jgi:hypothetical protein